jgi:hypothetical protein
MHSIINRIGLSRVYPEIQCELNGIAQEISALLLSQTQATTDAAQLAAQSKKLGTLKNIVFLLNSPLAVCFINEYILTLDYLTQSLEPEKIFRFSKKIEYIGLYLEDIIQGYGDVPIYYVFVLDELRALRNATLYSACTYVVNSVEQKNIATYPPKFNKTQKERIEIALSFLKKNIESVTQDNIERIIQQVSHLKQELEGTQHAFLWQLIHACFWLERYYQDPRPYLLQSLLIEII